MLVHSVTRSLNRCTRAIAKQDDVASGASATHKVSCDVASGASATHEFSFDVASGASATHEFSCDVANGASATHEFSCDVANGASATHKFFCEVANGASATHEFSCDVTVCSSPKFCWTSAARDATAYQYTRWVVAALLLNAMLAGAPASCWVFADER